MVIEGKVAQLEQNYAQQLIAYQELFQLTQQLEGLCTKEELEEEEVELLVQLLDRRQGIIEEVDQLNTVNSKLRGDLGESAQGSRLVELLGARDHLLTKIVAINNRCGEALAEKLKKVGSAIDKIQAGKQLNKAYSGNEYQSEGFFFDQKK